MTAPWDLNGKTVLVTGANTGIGRETALRLAERGARLLLACRSGEKAQPVLDAITSAHGPGRAEFVALDLGSLSSVRQSAATLLKAGEPIHVLINNAGMAGATGLTRDGFEEHFGVNHLGPYLFTSLLEPLLRAAAPSRIVIVASRAHARVRGVDWDSLRQPARTTSGFTEYSQSKLCNVLHARELSRRLQGTGVDVYALHPGVIASDIWRRVPWPFRQLMHLFMEDNRTGALPSIRCASAPELSGVSGRYYDRLQETEPSAAARDPALAVELWKRSAQWCGLPP